MIGVLEILLCQYVSFAGSWICTIPPDRYLWRWMPDHRRWVPLIFMVFRIFPYKWILVRIYCGELLQFFIPILLCQLNFPNLIISKRVFQIASGSSTKWFSVCDQDPVVKVEFWEIARVSDSWKDMPQQLKILHPGMLFLDLWQWKFEKGVV